MNPRDDPAIMEASKTLMQAVLELHCYADSHRLGAPLGENIEALVAVGALSRETADFVSKHQGRFYGFERRVTSPEKRLVFDVSLAGRTPPLRFEVFHDGHGSFSEMK